MVDTALLVTDLTDAVEAVACVAFDELDRLPAGTAAIADAGVGVKAAACADALLS